MAAIFKSIVTKIKEKCTGKDEYIISYAEFNGFGNEVLLKEFDENGVLTRKSITNYNDKNQKNGKLVYDGNGFLVQKVKFFYKPDGKIGSEEYAFDGGITWLKTYFYKDNSLMVRTINEDDEEKERIVYLYDTLSQKVLTKSEYGFKGKEIKRTEFIYDTISGRLENKKVTDFSNGFSDVVQFGYDTFSRLVSEEDTKILKTFEYN
jgi:YD repeat-containing protein